MQRLNILLGIGCLLSISPAFAQNELDALRYSRTTICGTARSSAMGGAFGALGADFSSLASNPAGLGLYRRNEVTFTPSLYSSNSEASFLGSTTVDQKYNFNFGNAGIVIHYSHNEDETNPSWKGFNFGFGYNRTNNFHDRYSINGVNSTSSLTTQFLKRANGTHFNNLNGFAEKLAFDTYLIDFVDTLDPRSYKSAVPDSAVKNQFKAIERGGSMGEMDFSFGANYNHRLYLGATIAFQRLRFTESSVYQEDDRLDSIHDFKGFTFSEHLTSEGRGVNLKLGLIFRATDNLRLGGYVHSPTNYTMSETFGASMRTRFDNGDNLEKSSPDGSFGYRLLTPLRAGASAAIIIKKSGVISADYELVDYTLAHLSSSSYNFYQENAAIKSKYKATSNVRLGTEWRYEQFSFRGGYALYGNPFKSNISNSSARHSYTGGIGYKEDSFFIDLAYVLTSSSENYYLYDPSIVAPVNTKLTTGAGMLTVGFRY